MKGFFKSKINLAALLSLVIALFNHFSPRDFAPGTVDEVLAIDWSNVTQGALAVLILIFRNLFSGSRISGLFGGKLFG
jgi:hypothetical protein